MTKRLYVASSWRNPDQAWVVPELRGSGFEVYDFKNPKPGNSGFSWREVSPNWEQWTPAQWRSALTSPISQRGYGFDRAGMDWADTCVLLLPSGRSAHLEAGFMAGQGKPVFTLLFEKQEPELMALLLGPADNICLSYPELLSKLGV